MDGKGGRVGLTTFHLYGPIVMKCGSSNLLETSGPVQACVGIALSFRFTYNLDTDVTVMS